MKHLLLAATLVTLSAGTALGNSQSIECHLVGAHLSPTIMLTMSKDENAQESKFIERDQENETDLNIKQAGIQLTYAKKGDTDILYSKSSRATYKIVALEDTKALGEWQSKPLSDECAPYSAVESYSLRVEVSRIEDSKTRARKAALMVCESTEGYHGYYGQGNCPDIGE